LISHLAFSQATHLLFTSQQQAANSKLKLQTATQFRRLMLQLSTTKIHLPPPAARCIPLGVDSETTAATSHAEAQDPDANCGAR